MDWGASIPDVGPRGADARARVPAAHGRRRSGDRGRHGRRDRAAAVTRIAGLTGATLTTAPTVCHECTWWQSRTGATRRQAEVDPGHRGRVGGMGHRVLRRRPSRARLDAVRPVRVVPACGRAACRTAERRRGPRDLRVPHRSDEAVGDAVAVPHRDRRGARPRCAGARGVRLPLRRGRVGVRPLPRAQDDLPAGLPLGLRVPDDAHAGPRGARAARAGRPAAGARRARARRCCASCARPSSRRRRRSGRRDKKKAPRLGERDARRRVAACLASIMAAGVPAA